MRPRIFIISLLIQLVVSRSLNGLLNGENNSVHKKLVARLEETRLSIVENDILIFNRSDLYKESALKDWSVKWPDGKVPVIFSDSFSTLELAEIIGAMMEIHENTCVRFHRADEDEDAFLVFLKPSYGECSSMVGRQGGHQPIQLSYGCFSRRTILHELMHALGFIHEHNRSDRDEYVTINWENIKEGKSHNFNKRSSDDLDFMQTEYAYESIMHYPEHNFAINPLLPTIVSKREGVKLGGEDRLSDIDIHRINKYYQCDASTTVMPATTSTTEEPEELLSTTEVPTTIEVQRIRGCTKAHDKPLENGECRWLIMRTSKDITSEQHYLICVPDSLNDDVRCGKWVRKECSQGTKYDKVLQACRRPPFIW